MNHYRAGILTCAVLGLLATSAGAVENRPPLGEAPAGGPIVSGTLDATIVNGCYALITGEVVTTNVGGTVGAAINFWDDGSFLGGQALAFPGDGGTHAYCYVYQQEVPVLQGAAGVGIYLEDQVGPAATETYDSDPNADLSDICTGPAPVCPSSVLSVPTIDRRGGLIFGLLLALAAAALLARRRSANT